jgi:steroid delta-isomerase-like uncharacterized protein
VKNRREAMGPHRNLLDRYVERYNAGDLDACVEFYGEDAVQAMPDGVYEGRAAIRERLYRDMEGFPDLAYTVTSYVEDGDAFADEFTFTGTHTGTFTLPDGTRLPPTGKRLEIKGMELARVRDGKIVVDNLYYDSMAVLGQLGLLPAAAPA